MRLILLLPIVLALSVFTHELMGQRHIKSGIYMSDGLAFINFNSDDSSLLFQEFCVVVGGVDPNDLILRGKAFLKHIYSDFYQFTADYAASHCMDSIRIVRVPTLDSVVNLRINLNNANNRYAIMAKQKLGTEVYRMIYNQDSILRLPPDSGGYTLSIVLDSICRADIIDYGSGYYNTIKFLLIPDVYKELYSDGCNMDIDIPYFTDDIFHEWSLDGDIVKIKNDSIIWNGSVYEYLEKSIDTVFSPSKGDAL